MKGNFFYSSVTALLITLNTPSFGVSNSDWYVAFGVGAQSTQWNSPLRISNGFEFDSPCDIDLYSTKGASGATVAFSVGRRWYNENAWFPAYSVGLLWQYLFRVNLGNTLITQYSLPEFANYTYHWQVASNVLMIAGKLNITQFWNMSLYINGGVGASINRSYDYNETALPGVTPRISPGFQDSSSSQVAYNLGFGFDFPLNPELIFSLGFVYQNLGNVASGSGIGTWSNASLNPGSYRSKELLLSVAYLFDGFDY